MKRRSFLQIPLLATSLVAGAEITQRQRAEEGFKVPSGKDRYDIELTYLGARFCCKVSGKDSAGAFCIYDSISMEKGGPAYHLHYFQDEWFYVIKGEFMFKIGHEMFYLKPGDSAFGPRKIPHAFAKTSEGAGQLLIVFQPAGSMELFFQEAGLQKNETPEAMQKLFSKHGMEMLGPPLKYE
jgi:mannose-6-phosphate isomerase-like protein (cupin superfamily)